MIDGLELNQTVVKEWMNKVREQGKNPKHVLLLGMCCSYSLVEQVLSGKKVPREPLRKLMAITMEKPVEKIWILKREAKPEAEKADEPKQASGKKAA